MTFDPLQHRAAVLAAKHEIEAMPEGSVGKEAALASISLFMQVTERHVRRAIALAKRRTPHD